MDRLDNGLDWGSASIFIKNQKVNIVFRPYCLHYSYSTWLAQEKGSHRQSVNKTHLQNQVVSSLASIC